jgi:hypothetical protein
MAHPPEAHVADIIGKPDTKLVSDLRAAHAVLRRSTIQLAGFQVSLLRKAVAPKQGREMRLVRLAFLAPDIQRAILLGYPIAYPGGEIPLAWEDQRQLFGFDAGRNLQNSKAS